MGASGAFSAVLQDLTNLPQAVTDALEHKRRTSAATRETLEREFRAGAVWSHYRAAYEAALERAS